MESGRKFMALMIFLALSAVETIVALWLHLPMPESIVSAQSGATMAFMAGNAVVSWAYAKSATSSESRADQTTKTISDRRDAANGVEPAP